MTTAQPPNETPSSREVPALPPEPQREVDIREQFDLFWRRRWLILIVTLAVFAGGMAYTLTRQPIYESQTKLVIATDPRTGGGSADDILGSVIDPLSSGHTVATQVEILNSRDLLDDAYRKLTPSEQKVGFRSYAIPSWAFSISSNRNSDVVVITAKAYKKELAAKLANYIAATYLTQDLNTNNASTKKAREFVQEQMSKTKERLKTAAEKLARFKRETRLYAPSVMVSAAAQEVFTLRGTVDTAKSDLQSASRRLQVIDDQVRKIAPEVPSSSTIQENPQFSTLRESISTLQGQLIAAQQEFTDNSVEVRSIKDQITEQEKRLRGLTRTIVTTEVRSRNQAFDAMLQALATATVDRAVANVRLSTATSVLADRESRLQHYPEQERVYADLQQDVDVLTRTLGALSDQYYSLLIREQQTMPYGKVVALARVPSAPSYPQKTRSIMIYLILGLLAGLAVAVGAERLDTRIHDPITVDRISSLPTLSAIPNTDVAAASGLDRLVIGSVENNHAFVESFRLLRNNIMFSAPGRKIRVLAVTSPSKSEGKSTVSVNLAIAMAMDGRRVLLIDGDLRRPTIHNWMGVSREQGLTTVVANLTTLEGAIRKTPYENVDCLPSGPLPPNPTEFLNSIQARQIVEKAATDYDLVLIDSPPCTGLSDVQVISTMVDGMVLVVTLNSTLKEHLVAAVRMLQQASAPVLGTVLNRIDYRRNTYGYYSYYYYYSSYEEDPTDGKKKKRRKKNNKKT